MSVKKNEIIARNQEIKLLTSFVKSSSSEFLAVYGRRRIGKTFLIREFLSAQKITALIVTGTKDGKGKRQLENFTDGFSALFHEDLPLKTLSFQNWKTALSALTTSIKKSDSFTIKKPFVLFLDELPWLAGAKSNLLQELDYFWNTQWSTLPQFKLIVCGSAASWMLEKLVNAKGGLHNRLTKILNLQPFSLAQTSEFLTYCRAKFTAPEIIDLYLVTGGVPFYLEKINPKLSVRQNIQTLCFSEDGFLKTEFPRLFKSLFDSETAHQALIETIAQKNSGLSRDEIAKSKIIQTGGRLSKYLNELEAAGFIKSFVPYGNQKRNQFFKVIDEYSLFYLKWIAPSQGQTLGFTKTHWLDQMRTPKWPIWAGLALEGICQKHFNEIREALGLLHIPCQVGTWRFVPSNKNQEGAQIDLLFDREDGIISLCEIKYSKTPYVLDKAEAKALHRKSEIFAEKTKTKKRIQIHLITLLGLKDNMWSEDTLSSSIALETCLFSPAAKK